MQDKTKSYKQQSWKGIFVQGKGISTASLFFDDNVLKFSLNQLCSSVSSSFLKSKISIKLFQELRILYQELFFRDFNFLPIDVRIKVYRSRKHGMFSK